jgi:serine/threonine protein kinase/Flp pilus assembly protein TadD
MSSDSPTRGSVEDEPLPRPRRRIGPYEVLSELGHGGMGVVYLAARADEQYQKRVALKVIKGGLDRDEVVRSFRRERQILAGLEHPNIARFLDGGTTEDGLPYFVMEHVLGERLDLYCDGRGLSTLERLKLFRAVCSAIAYAHRNLIVHRDLKPGNVLVTADGVPKLLDFGIAKITNAGLPASGETATATGFAMTPEYASPEQARGETVTTASDVYSLGVVLYELLTGQLPYRLKTRHPLNVLRAVCEDEPEKPSAAVARTAVAEPTQAMTTAEPTLPITAGAPPRPAREASERLRRKLKGDLDTIVLATLRKEPAQRYASVEALSEDIRRYMEGHPILARTPTFRYRARKFLGRHWAAVSAAAAALLVVVGFVANHFAQSASIRRERDKAARVSAFMVDLFKVSDPDEARGNSVTAREILDKGAERIRTELKDDPEVRATLLDTMGNVYRSLGLYERSEALLREALALRRTLGGDPVDLATTLHNLGTVISYRGDYAEAESLLKEALAMRRRLLGDENIDVSKTMNNLGTLLWDKGDFDGAEPLYRETVRLRRKLLGDDNPQVAGALQNLAILLHAKGDFREAEAVKREALLLQRRFLGDSHPDVARNMYNLGVTLQAEGDYAGAATAYRDSLALRRKSLGDEHPEVLDGLIGIASLLNDTGDPKGAEVQLREAATIGEKAYGKEHVAIADIRLTLADSLHLEHRLAESEAAYRDGLGLYRRLAKDHPNVAAALTGLGGVLLDEGQTGAAEPLLREAVTMQRKTLPADHPDTAGTESLLGACLAAEGRYAEAEPLLLQSYTRITARRSDGSREAREARARIVSLYASWGQPAKASQYAQRP